MNLIYKNEKPLFVLLLVISLLIWLGFILGTFGAGLLFLGFFFISYLFAQSAFISYIKGTAVKITASQFPDLHEKIEAACTKLELKKVPEAYILHANGGFNAFATRFLGRDFIVLFSDIIDAFDDHPDAINFYIGHEIGHIKRNHLSWAAVLFPAAILPLIGSAYARAREYTCDRHGLVACSDVTSAQFGLAALAAGGKRWRTMSKTDYVGQTRETTGFWMSFHEYLSDYPWLIKRMAALKALAAGREVSQPSRNFFAGFLALFVPRIGVAGGAGSLLVVVAIIAILAAVALPAYQDYTIRAKLVQAAAIGRQATVAVENYYYENQAIPQDLAAAGFSAIGPAESVQGIHVNDKNAIVSVTISVDPYNGKSIIFIPSFDAEKKIKWQCASEEIPSKVLPMECRRN